jgi:hypothetical protein
MAEEGLSWGQCVDICMLSARSSVGKTRCFIAHVKATAPECISSHCIIHRQVLDMKKIPIALKMLLDKVVKFAKATESKNFKCAL